jgi:hypothetical protein
MYVMVYFIFYKVSFISLGCSPLPALLSSLFSALHCHHSWWMDVSVLSHPAQPPASLWPTVLCKLPFWCESAFVRPGLDPAPILLSIVLPCSIVAPVSLGLICNAAVPSPVRHTTGSPLFYQKSNRKPAMREESPRYRKQFRDEEKQTCQKLVVYE